jgi:hypothetical protein
MGGLVAIKQSHPDNPMRKKILRGERDNRCKKRTRLKKRLK